MGERKCAIEGCNALEFRTSGVCLRHRDEGATDRSVTAAKPENEGGGSTESSTASVSEAIGAIMIFIGGSMSLVGFFWLFDGYVVAQMAGATLLVIGILFLQIGLVLYRGSGTSGFLLPFGGAFSRMTRVALLVSVIGFYAYQGLLT